MFVIGIALMALSVITAASAFHAKTNPEAYTMQTNDHAFSSNAMVVTTGYIAPMMPFNK